MNEYIKLTPEDGINIVKKITDDECRKAISDGFMVWIRKGWKMTEEEEHVERWQLPGCKYPNVFSFSDAEIRLALDSPADKSIFDIVKERIVAPLLQGYYLGYFIEKYIWLDWDCRGDKGDSGDEEYESMLRYLTLMYLLRHISKDFMPRLSRLFYVHEYKTDDGDFWDRARCRAAKHNAKRYVPESFGELPALSIDGKTPAFEEMFVPDVEM